MRVCIKEDNDDFPSVPPGFESFTSFNLTRVNDGENQDDKSMHNCLGPASASEHPIKMETSMDISDAVKITRSLRRKPGINYGRAEDECDPEQPNQVGVLV